MTLHACSHACGEWFDNSVNDCPKCGQPSNGVRISVALPILVATPETVGAEIRRLLVTLRAPGHTVEEERTGVMNYATDILRAQALDAANICWLGSGKMHNARWPCNGRPAALDGPTQQSSEAP